MSTTNQSHQTTPLLTGNPPSVAAAPIKPTAKKVVSKPQTTTPATQKLVPKTAATKAVASPASSPAGQTTDASVPATKPAAGKTTRSVKAVKAVRPIKPAKALKAAKAPKVTAKPASAAKKAAQTASPAVKIEKPKKAKLVRDSFTIPKAEYLVLDDLKLRANKLMNPAKKSELLRAGIKALSAMTDSALLAALKQVPAIKTGRPTSKV